MTPKVSVIIPVFNVDCYLRQCLDSVVRQTLLDIEIILIDDGSKDRSIAICQEYVRKDSRIRFIQQQNKGPGITRNRGINIAKGEYIAFLDSDDYWDLDALKFAYTKANYLDLDVFLFEANAFTDNDPMNFFPYVSLKDVIPTGILFSDHGVLNYSFELIRGAVWFGLYKTDFIKKWYCRFGEKTNNMEDLLFSMKTILFAKRILYVNKVLIYHRMANMNSLTNNREKSFKDFSIVVHELQKDFMNQGMFEVYQKMIVNKCIDACRNFINHLREPIRSFALRLFIQSVIPLFKLDSIDQFFFCRKYLFNFISSLRSKQGLSQKLEQLFYSSDRKKVIPIVFSANEEYAWYLMVTIQSIIGFANPDKFYDIYLLHTNVSFETQMRLEELSKDNVRITCMDINLKSPQVISFPETKNHPKEMWYRFLIPNLFYGYEKVIYLDSDTILNADISELFDIDLCGKVIATCPALLKKDFQMCCAKKLNPKNYVSSAVLIFNILEWNKKNLTSKVYLEALKSNSYRVPDQDVLNRVVDQDDIYFLSSEWNYKVIPHFMIQLFYKRKIGCQSKDFTSPKLLHYISQYKPWKNVDSDYNMIWWAYARKSPFYEAILFRNQSD